jgi:hypothetical protein
VLAGWVSVSFGGEPTFAEAVVNGEVAPKAVVSALLDWFQGNES